MSSPGADPAGAAPSGVFCSFADSRSWTDPITNLSTIAHADSVAVARQLLAGDLPLPVELFPTLVHEFTHQSFFRTRVFSALAHVRLRACADLLSERRRQAGVRQLAVYECTLAMLRPLAEGAAMFAECDLKSSLSSEIGSLTLSSVLHLFVAEDAELEEGLREVLSAARSSRAMLDRKVNLLGSPLGSADGGYSMGYLALKCLWLHATGDTEDDLIWDESDRWLRYVRKFFFEDPGLLIAILDPTGDLDTITRRVADALSARLATFFRDFDPELDLAVFEEHTWDAELLAEDGYVSFAHSAELCEALHITVEDERRARGLFETALLNVTEDSLHGLLGELAPTSHDHLNMLGNVLVYSSMVAASRQDMHIAGLPVRVAIGADGVITVTAEGEVVVAYAASEFGAYVWADQPPGAALDGRIDVYIPTNPVSGVADTAVRLERLVVISIGDEPVTVRRYGRPEPPDRDELAAEAEHIRFVVRSRKAFAMMESVTTLGLGKHSGNDPRPAELPALVERIYFSWAAMGIGLPTSLSSALDQDVRRRLLDQHDAKLRRTGILELFGLDRELIESLALLGLCNSVDPSAEHITRTFAALGLSVGEFVASVNRLQESTGLPRMLTYGALAACIV